LPTALPFALTSEFAEDTNKQKQWLAFMQRGQLKTARVSLSEVITVIGAFLMPPCLAKGEQGFLKTWTPEKQWFDS
jgi:hypothetical protein